MRAHLLKIKLHTRLPFGVIGQAQSQLGYLLAISAETINARLIPYHQRLAVVGLAFLGRDDARLAQQACQRSACDLGQQLPVDAQPFIAKINIQRACWYWYRDGCGFRCLSAGLEPVQNTHDKQLLQNSKVQTC